MGCFLGAIFLFRGRVAFRGKSSLRFSCLTLGMLILPFFFLYLLNQAQPFKAVKYTLLFLPSSMALIWTLLDPKGLFSRLLSCRPFVWLGNLSPYTFLIHLVAIRYVCLALPGMEARFNLLLVLLSFLVTVAAAILYQKAVNARKRGS
jgi:peptidoglycan/LPS O-acetylase OafA/YrhL